MKMFEILEDAIDEIALWNTHLQQKEKARTITDEQEEPRKMYTDAISANDGEYEVPADMAMRIFQAPC